ncbi:MAG: ABC transporter substrate-binding protein [Synergistaceae bacterium]|jgi:ABC-type nitrate/sulfonate/bicarbonate transport system substrate-binding protein|nr:ABC transporter substrate-binding protein [Synergistaceae bacterium]
MTEIKSRSHRIITMVLVCAAFLGISAGSAYPAGDLFPIRTSTRFDCTLAPYLVADKLGFFKEEGLELVFTGELPSTEYTTAILAGETDFADHHPNALALQIHGGAKVKAVGRSIIEPDESADPRLRHMRYYVTREAYDAGVKTLADLGKYKEGEKLKSAGVENTCETFILNKALDRVGVSRDKLEWISVDADVAKIQAQKLNQFDIIGVHPPFYDAAVEAGLVQIGDSSDAKLGEATGVYLYYFSNDFIEKHPNEVAGFVRAMTKAQRWANANLEQTAKWTGEFIGQDVKGNHYYSETTEIDEETVLPWIEDLEKTGALPAGAIKVSDIVTHQFEAK